MAHMCGLMQKPTGGDNHQTMMREQNALTVAAPPPCSQSLCHPAITRSDPDLVLPGFN